MTVSKAVVLAAGRGTRMKRPAAGGEALSGEQERAAALGHKALMPVGRPFLDYVLAALADAGLTQVCLIVAAGASAIRDRYTSECIPTRVRLSFAEQAEPLGTAHALLAARSFVGADRFVVLNADNYYPAAVLRTMAECEGNAVGAFDVDALVRLGNVPIERVRDYARLVVGPDGILGDVEEKPASRDVDRATPTSMNLWTFDSSIFEACERVPRSERGEYELPQAVRHAIRERGLRIRAVPLQAGVLDLGNRADIPSVTRRLGALSVHV